MGLSSGNPNEVISMDVREREEIFLRIEEMKSRYEELLQAYESWEAVADSFHMVIIPDGMTAPHHAEDEVQEFLNKIETEMMKIGQALEDL
jgi:hypothetical protein